ncbi:hypothetical protein [Acaryochloris marina]|nr:hypothetical protein [Acaryochloris marina]
MQSKFFSQEFEKALTLILIDVDGWQLPTTPSIAPLAHLLVS